MEKRERGNEENGKREQKGIASLTLLYTAMSGVPHRYFPSLVAARYCTVSWLIGMQGKAHLR